MIQELKIKNFKSFRDEAELSFEPSGEDIHILEAFKAERKCLRGKES